MNHEINEFTIYSIAMKNSSLLILMCLALNTLLAQEDVTIGKAMKFNSRILNGEVSYYVHLPESYNNYQGSYPVIYMMNGNSVPSFANAASTIDNLSNDRIPDMILIGISNTGVSSGFRFCPDENGNPGDTFRNFLNEELVPEVKSKFRTNNYKILFGQSNTSLVVLNLYMSQPGLFNAYIVASPMFGWCPEFYIGGAREFFKNNPCPAGKLYISYGDLDYVEVLRYISDFKEVLQLSSQEFRYKAELIENSGHVPFASLNNALLYFFAECTIDEQRKKLSIPELKSWYEKISAEYGFTVIPKAGVLFDMAIDNKNENDSERAIALFRYLISLYPDSEIYYYFLGQTYLQKGDTENAKVCFSESLKINPEFKQAGSALEKLNVR